jgi:branched-subunit amino acid ABC-type transport system permease component
MAGIVALPVLGIAVIYGMTGIINFAVGGIGVFSAFITWQLLPYNMALAILAGLAAGFALGYAIQATLLTPLSARRGGDLNLFFLITNNVGLIFVGLTRVVFPRPNIGLPLPRLGTITILGVQTSGLKFLALFIAIGSLLLLRVVERYTRVGKSWRATSQNLRLAQIVGVNTSQAFNIASGLGCMLAAFGAIIWGSLYNLTLNSGFDLTFLGYIIAVVGGIGNILGGMVAALIVGLALSFSAYIASGSWQSVILYGIAMFTLIVAPKGILGSERSI